MFKDTHAFSSFSVDDIQKAREFYGQTLGVGVSEEEEGRALKIAGEATYSFIPNRIINPLRSPCSTFSWAILTMR